MRISARADYAVRAALHLALLAPGERASSETIARERRIPARFLEGILTHLRRAGIAESRRGSTGGYRLARGAERISVADVIRAVEGPLVYVRDERPSEIDVGEDPSARVMVDLWVALRASVRDVLEATTLADLAAGRLREPARRLVDDPASWRQSSTLGD